MICDICKEQITDGDDVIGLINGLMEDKYIDVQSTLYVHYSCYRDTEGKLYPKDTIVD